jgi:hypothetical protein
MKLTHFYYAFTLVFSLAYVANADELITSGNRTVTIESKPFSYSWRSATAQQRSESFCLPRGKQLVKVIGVNAADSNTKADISVNGDASTNCVNLDIMLPPAPRVCAKVPAPTWLNPGRFNDLCSEVPASLSFSVQYETRNDDAGPKEP